MFELVKESAWLQMHNLIHGYCSIDKTIDDTKRIVKDAWKRFHNGSFDPLNSTKGLCDCIEFYNRYKTLLDD
ncbi:hypothetical protein [Flagellimonas onchidii]|uniref:hypothetical protein n=1 Tax=Flagellimonas onchidii TaxID=2562684 RepID=UPI0010A69CF4|nr:hypothetical protein [Allomuricauda onchidii]